MKLTDKYLIEAKKPAQLGGLSPKTRKVLDTADEAVENLLRTFKEDIKRTNYGQKGKLDNIEKKLLSDLKQTDINWGKIWENFVRLARDIETGYAK